MPELGSLDRRQIAALADLAPVAKDTGLRENRRVIKGGRGQVRNAGLTARGKPPEPALATLMRKMLVTLNAMLKARTTWQDPRQT